jgi:glucosyl-dolichyl phosphate glucuronosyltransferase
MLGVVLLPKVTVAVSTFRESYFDWMLQLLNSFKRQTFMDFNVLLIVNTNHKYFKKLRDAIKSKDYPFEIQIIFNPVDHGIAFARNLALKNTDSQFIAYTDDDVIPHYNWLKIIDTTFSTSRELNLNIGAVTGPIIANWWGFSVQNSWSWFPKELYWVIGCTVKDFPKMRTVRNGFASNLALDCKAATCCGGFNEIFGYKPTYRMAGEEPELCLKLKKAGKFTVWNPELIVNHRITPNRMRLHNIIIRSYIEGRTKAHLKKVVGHEAIEVEANHMLLVIKALLNPGSFKAKAYLVSSTSAVAIGYLITNVKIHFKRASKILSAK